MSDAAPRAVDPVRAEQDAAEASLRPLTLDEFVGQRRFARQSARLHRSGQGPARSPRPRAALRTAGARQDDAGADRRPRNGRGLPRHLGPGDPARRRPRGAADQSAAARRALHRRDPPACALGRGDPLSGDGGFSARPDHRRGAGGAVDPHRCGTLHPDRCDDAVGADHPAAARALRHTAAAGLL